MKDWSKRLVSLSMTSLPNSTMMKVGYLSQLEEDTLMAMEKMVAKAVKMEVTMTRRTPTMKKMEVKVKVKVRNPPLKMNSQCKLVTEVLEPRTWNATGTQKRQVALRVSAVLRWSQILPPLSPVVIFLQILQHTCPLCRLSQMLEKVHAWMRIVIHLNTQKLT